MDKFFRVWNVETKSYDDNLHCCFIDCDGELKVRDEFDNKGRFDLYDYHEGAVEYNTGIFDKNHKGIYEEDKIFDGEHYGVVVWRDGGWVIMFEDTEGVRDYEKLNVEVAEMLEIVGTSHDNEEETMPQVIHSEDD